MNKKLFRNYWTQRNRERLCRFGSGDYGASHPTTLCSHCAEQLIDEPVKGEMITIEVSHMWVRGEYVRSP